MRWRERILDLLLVAGAVRAALLLFWYFSGSHGIGRHHIESTLFITAAVALLALGVRNPPARPLQESRDPLPTAWLAVSLLGLALLLYGRVLGLGWLSDDWVLADWSRRGEFAGASHEFVRPLPLIIWGAILAAGGGAVGTHALNLALHVVNAVLAALVARQLHAGRHAATASGVLFLVWPTQVEAIAWASGIFDVLCTAFVLLAVFIYLRFAQAPSLGRGAAVLACAVAALVSKESALALPLLIAVASLPRWVATRPRRAEVAAFSALTALTAAYGAWRLFIRPSARALAGDVSGRYAFKEIVSRTFGTLAVPFDAEWIAAHPVVVFAAACIPLTLAGLSIVLARHRSDGHRLAVQGSAWALCIVLPSIGYAFVGPYLQGSRYVYGACVGWSWLLASSALMDGGPVRRLAQKFLLVMLVGLAVIQDQRLVRDWRQAAATREAIIRSAVQLATREGCGELRLSAPIPDYRGTQLFRNGFELAVRQARPATSGGAPCDVAWDGSQMHRR